MKILIVAATSCEIKPLLSALGQTDGEEFSMKTFQYHQLHLDVLITGVGLMQTAYFMGRRFVNHTYDLALNFGIAGSFNKNISIGEVANVTEEQIADLGAEDNENFLDIIELKLLRPDQFPYNSGKLINKIPDWAQEISNLKVKVKGISVNTVHGNQHSIDKIIQKYQPDLESMEGAAFLYACLIENIPCLQIRAVSNYVENRNKDTWNIPLAIENLNKTAMKIIHHISGSVPL
ncbi:MAG: futalosine hydrolase [Candidatus Jettenia sp. CY-1]|nr:MAG: futalosine hydrolase [Candidatus Jettenia sp. CY-1]